MLLWLVISMLLIGVLTWGVRRDHDRPPEVSYSKLYRLIDSGSVKSVVLSRGRVEGTLSKGHKLGKQSSSKRFVTQRPARDDALLEHLRSHGVTIEVHHEQKSWLGRVAVAVLPWLLIIGAGVWLMHRARVAAQRSGGGPFGMAAPPTQYERVTAEDADVGFDQVAGLAAAKRDLSQVVDFLREPRRFAKLGGKIPRGILLVGPPGTGKTLLARAVAGEAGVPFYASSAPAFIELFVGMGARRVRELFEEAKKHAPSIVFLDEIDAIGRARGAGLGGGHDEREQTLNQLLSEMDGFKRRDLVIVIAATNRPDVLDPALQRPGRFDRRVVVDKPERAARRAILEIHLADKPLDDDVDVDALADATPGFSGAELENLANEAALAAGERHAERLADRDFSDAYDKVVLGNPRDGKLDGEERHRIAVHEAGHALVAHHTAHADPLRRVTIIPRGMSLGATQQRPDTDRHVITQPQLEAQLRIVMGGYAAERVVLGSVSTGAEDDLRRATEIATRMVAHFGMGERLGAAYYDHHSDHPFLGKRIAMEGTTSQETVHAIEAEARGLLDHALQQARQLIERERARHDELVRRLEQSEALDVTEIEEILGPPCGDGDGDGAFGPRASRDSEPHAEFGSN